MSNKKSYVYILINPLKNKQPFYVGKGKRDRKQSHFQPNSIKTDTNLHKVNTIKQIIEKTGVYPPIEIFADNLSNAEACFLEEELIAYYGRQDLKKGILTNLTNGGDGAEGYRPSEETKKKMSEAHKGEKAYWFGKNIPEYVKQKMRKPKSPEARKHMTEAKRNYFRVAPGQPNPKSVETRKKMSEAQKRLYENGYRQSKEQRKKNSEANKGSKNGFYGKTHSKEFLERRSEEQKGLISAKDKFGNKFKVYKNDPRWISGELVGITKKIQTSLSKDKDSPILP